MKLKYSHIIVVIVILNILNTTTALADISHPPEETVCFCIFPPLAVVLSIIIGIYGIRYVKNQRSIVNENDTPEKVLKDKDQL